MTAEAFAAEFARGSANSNVVGCSTGASIAYGVDVWFDVLAPAKTPKDVVAQLATWFKAAMQAPDVKPKLAKLGLYPGWHLLG